MARSGIWLPTNSDHMYPLPLSPVRLLVLMAMSYLFLWLTLTYDLSQVHDLIWTRVGIGMFLLRPSLRLCWKQILQKALLGISWDARIVVLKIAGTHCSSSANRFYLGYKYLAPVEKLCHLSEDLMCVWSDWITFQVFFLWVWLWEKCSERKLSFLFLGMCLHEGPFLGW